MYPHPKTVIGKPPYRLLTFSEECSIQCKISLYMIAQHTYAFLCLFFFNYLAEIKYHVW